MYGRAFPEPCALERGLPRRGLRAGRCGIRSACGDHFASAWRFHIVAQKTSSPLQTRRLWSLEALLPNGNRIFEGPAKAQSYSKFLNHRILNPGALKPYKSRTRPPSENLVTSATRQEVALELEVGHEGLLCLVAWLRSL